MKIRNRDVDDILATVRQQLQDDKTLSVSLRTTMELLIALIQVLAWRLGTDSANSSKPPSEGPNHAKKSRRKGERKPGGQPGRIGKTLQPLEDPDVIRAVTLDRRTLPCETGTDLFPLWKGWQASSGISGNRGLEYAMPPLVANTVSLGAPEILRK